MLVVVGVISSSANTIYVAGVSTPWLSPEVQLEGRPAATPPEVQQEEQRAASPPGAQREQTALLRRQVDVLMDRFIDATERFPDDPA